MTGRRTAAIVVAGGVGERLGLSGGKQLALVAGRPVLSWTVSAFDESSDVDEIVVVCHPERIDEYRTIAVDPISPRTPLSFAPGGETRQASVASGLAALPLDVDIIVVQDGARPMATPDLVRRVLDALESSPDAAGAVVGYPAVDTLKLAENGRVLETPDRSRFWAVQTPQAFRAEALRAAYSAAADEGFLGTDDASLIERAGGSVLLVEGPRDNIKVTVAEDLLLVEAALKFRFGEGSS